MSTPITTESLLASINETVLAVEEAQETLVSQTEDISNHKASGATATSKSHVYLKDAMGDESAASGATALTPKALKDFSTENSGVIINVRDMLRAEVEAVSGGRNTVLRDSGGNPHVMVVVPKFRLQDIDESLGTGIHPAFIVNGVEKSEFFIGKYLASRGPSNVLLTIPRKDPYRGLSADEAVTKCRALGSGFCCVTNAMWSARALYLWKLFGGSEGTHTYYGNTYGGASAGAEHLTGTLAPVATGVLGEPSSSTGHPTLTGSGPVEWNDDGTAEGICDFVGNVSERVAGLRIVGGEIQIIQDNNAASSLCDLSSGSSSWKAISSSGTLVSPGTSGTMKYTKTGSIPVVAVTGGTSDYSGSTVYVSFGALGGGSSNPPAILKRLGLFPVASNVQGYIYFGGDGYGEERLALRSGYWNASGINNAQGPFYLTWDLRSKADSRYGIRVGYVA